MNRMSSASFSKADAEMNKVYRKVMAALDGEGQAKLKTAQRAWLVYRDAQAELDADTIARGGTMFPQIYEGTRAELTNARIAVLKITLDSAGL